MLRIAPQTAILFSTFVAFAVAGCNDSGFSGSTAPKKSEDSMVADPDDFVSDNDTDNNNNSSSGNPLGDPTDTDSDTDFGDFFGDLDNDTDIGIDDPDLTFEDTSVTFGANEVFHLGDGSFDGSSCKFTVDTFNLSGTRYFFEFDVEENNTVISIRVNRICGVDYGDTNFAFLYKDGQQVESMQIPTGSLMLAFNTTMVNAGRYRIEVEARTGAALDTSPGKTDSDDFIIGDLNIRGSKRIVRGQFGSN